MRIPKKKNPVYVPPKNAPNVILQNRDKLIFKFIAEYDRCIADYQILQLLQREAKCLREQGKEAQADELETTPEALDVRLGKLAQAGYIHKLERWKRESFDYGIYWLTKRGAQQHAEDDWKAYVFANNPDFRQTVHDIAIIDYRLHIENNCNAVERLELVEWTNQGIFKDDPDSVEFVRRNGRRSHRNLIPDGYYLVRDLRSKSKNKTGQAREIRLLFEMDMGTKDRNKMIDEKILPGIAYVQSDVYKRRFGANRGWWTYVCPDVDTMFLLKRKVELYTPFANMFWFTHPDYVNDCVLTEPIWWRGGVDNATQVSLLDD